MVVWWWGSLEGRESVKVMSLAATDPGGGSPAVEVVLVGLRLMVGGPWRAHRSA